MKLSATLCRPGRFLALLLLFCLSFSLSAQLAPGDVMIVAIVTDSDSGPTSPDANCGDGFAFVALVPIPANEVVLFTENEFTGGVFTTGEGTLSWTNSASVLPAGTVVQVTTNASTSGNCPTPSASTGTVAFVGADAWELSTSNEEIYVFQGSLASPTLISALLTNNAGTGGQTNTPPASISGFLVDFTGVDIDADLGIYTGGTVFPSKAAAAAAIVNVASNWTLEDGGTANECCDADGVDYPADIPAMFTIGMACVDPTIALSQNPLGTLCPTASVNIVINGGADPGTTAYTLRTGSAAGPIINGPVVTPQFTINSIQGTTTYFVTTPNCMGGTVSESITIMTMGTAANAGPDQLNLMGTSTTLSGSNPSPGTGVWTETSGDGNGMFGDATSPTSSFSGTPGVTYTLQWEVINPGCATTSDEVMVSFSAASTLAIGDLAFTGYNSDNPDTFSFVIFTDIGTGTVINFTDNGWLASGAFRTGEGLIALTFGGMATCGDQFFVTGGNFLNYDGSPAGTVTSISGSVDLSINGDQIFAFQGTLGSPTLLAAIQMNGDWDADATDAQSSAQPQVFIDNPGTSLAISPEVDNAVFDCSNLPGGISANRLATNTPANWETSNTSTSGIPPVDCIAGFGCCELPVITNLSYSPDPVCPGAGNNITLTITGSLNDATEWVVYTISCGGTEVLRSSNSVINLGSLATVGTTTIYVRGEGGCVPAGGDCTTLDIVVAETVTALCVAPFNVQLDAAGMATITPAQVDNGSTACTTPTLSLDVNTFTCAEVGPNLVTLTVEDQSNNTATCSVTVTVQDATGPQAICQPIDVYLDANGEASITPADVDNGSNDNCGISSSTVVPDAFDCDDVAGNPNMVTLTVFDAAGNMATCVAQVTVLDTVRPVFTCQDITVSLDANGMFSIPSANFVRDNIQTNFQDNCATISAEFGITVNSWNCSNIGDNSTTISARDGNGNETPCTITVTVTDPLMTCNQAPVAVCQPVIVNADANCEATTVTAEDFDGGSTDEDMDQLTFSVSPVGPYALGTTNVTLTVSDGALMSQCTTTVTVNDVTAPVIVCEDITVAVGASGSVTITNNQAVVSITDNCPGNISGPFTVGGMGNRVFTCTAVGTTVARTVVATDAAGNQGSCTYNVTVIDEIAPTVTCTEFTATFSACPDAIFPNSPSGTFSPIGNLSDFSVAAGGIYVASFDLTGCVDDNCSSEGFQSAFVDSYEENRIPGCSVDIVNVVVIRDDAGNQAADSIFFRSTIAFDGDAPVFTVCPADSLIDCGVVPTVEATDATATSGCGTPVVTVSEAVIVGTPNFAGTTYTFTYTATDGCGRMTTCEQVFTVQDTTAPIIICEAITVALDSNGEAVIADDEALVSVEDNCEGSISGPTVDGGLSARTFDCTFADSTFQRTATVLDASGNPGSCTFSVTVVDEIAPIVMANDTTLYLDENGLAELAVEDYNYAVSDNCFAEVTDLFRLPATMTTLTGSGAAAGAAKVEGAKFLDQVLTFTCDDVGNVNLQVEIEATDGSG
ncbi:hypothetical protein H9S92_05780, partial [Lewinella lacunae]